MGISVFLLLKYGLFGSLAIFTLLLIMVLIGGILQGFGTFANKILSFMPGSKRIKQLEAENLKLQKRAQALSEEVKMYMEISDESKKSLNEEINKNFSEYLLLNKELEDQKEKYYELLDKIFRDELDKESYRAEWFNYEIDHGFHITLDYEPSPEWKKRMEELKSISKNKAPLSDQ